LYEYESSLELSIQCPFCLADVGQHCRFDQGTYGIFHTERTRAITDEALGLPRRPFVRSSRSVMAVNAKYVKRSVCECGFPALEESTPMGKLYTAYRNQVATFKMICGGCRKSLTLKFITVDDGQKPLGMLPLEIFEFDEGVAA